MYHQSPINSVETWDSFVQELLSPIDIHPESSLTTDAASVGKEDFTCYSWSWSDCSINSHIVPTFASSPSLSSPSDSTKSLGNQKVPKKPKSKTNRQLQPFTEYSRKWKPIYREQYPELTKSQLHRFTVRQFQVASARNTSKIP
jgi:hypothetical protein